MTSQMIHRIARTALPENGVVTFEVAGDRYLVADVEGDVRAFLVAGPAAKDLERTAVAEGHVRCPRHGWPVDLEAGRCGAGDYCSYQPLSVEVGRDEIRVSLPTP